MITEFAENCVICNRPATDVHHMIFGTANRKLADKDGLTMPLCREHHEMVHRNKELKVMSQIAGQLAFEKKILAENDVTEETARQDFMIRYGRSYL
jgi:hypothetical protein